MTFWYLEDNELKHADCLPPCFDKSCDILCVGAGSAGVYCASTASEEGADVILLEYDSNIGGMHVCGNVLGYYYGLAGGAYQEDDNMCAQDTVFFKGGISPEAKQVHMTERLENAGVMLMCSCTPTGIYFDGNRAVGLRVLYCGKEINISGKYIIDATSDGHIVRMCPVKKYYGRSFDGSFVPFTVRAQYIKDGKYFSSNTDSGYIDQYNAFEFSDKVICAKAEACKYILKGEFLNIASRTGLREGLSFEGEQSLDYKDILFDREPEKVLFYAYSDLDKHGHDHAFDSELYQNWWVISNLSTVTIKIPVPFGCIVPKGLDGIISAGRCISADTYSKSAVRMNRDMFRMGECIGIAASMAVSCGTSVLNIDYESYITKAKSRGCYGSDIRKKYGFDYPGGNKPYVPVSFGVKENFHLLDTDTPGVFTWSCFIDKDKERTAEIVYKKLKDTNDPLTKKNCAIALGIMGDKRCLETLREMVNERDCFYYKDCRRSNQFAGVIAVCLLGRLGTEADAALLEQIIFDPEEIKNPIYHTLPKDYLYFNSDDRNFVYYFYFTHACAALVKLYKNNGLDTQALKQRFKKLFSDNSYITKVTCGAPDSPAFSEMENLKKLILSSLTTVNQ